VLLACIPACTTEDGAADGGLDPWKQSCACPGTNSQSQYMVAYIVQNSEGADFWECASWLTRRLGTGSSCSSLDSFISFFKFWKNLPDSQDALGDWLACLGLGNKERERILEEGWDLGDFAVLSKGEITETASALRITRAKAWRVTRYIVLWYNLVLM
jgi:hypothetical protein